MLKATLTNAACKDIDRLRADVAARIVAALRALEEDGRPKGVTKLGGHEFTHRLRVGDYRITYDVNDFAREVVVLRVRHRRDIYRLFL